MGDISKKFSLLLKGEMVVKELLWAKSKDVSNNRGTKEKEPASPAKLRWPADSTVHAASSFHFGDLPIKRQVEWRRAMAKKPTVKLNRRDIKRRIKRTKYLMLALYLEIQPLRTSTVQERIIIRQQLDFSDIGYITSLSNMLREEGMFKRWCMFTTGKFNSFKGRNSSLRIQKLQYLLLAMELDLRFFRDGSDEIRNIFRQELDFDDVNYVMDFLLNLSDEGLFQKWCSSPTNRFNFFRRKGASTK